jgi:hypothetical protein
METVENSARWKTDGTTLTFAIACVSARDWPPLAASASSIAAASAAGNPIPIPYVIRLLTKA